MTTNKIGFLVIEIEQRSFKIAELEQQLDRLKKERDEIRTQFKHELFQAFGKDNSPRVFQIKHAGITRLFTVDARGAITEEKQVFEV